MLTRQLVATMILSASLGACSTGKDFWVEHRTNGEADVLATDAGARLVTATPISKADSAGRFQPTQVNCAEPSPDVAKAIETAFSAGMSINISGQGAELPAEAQAKIAGAIAQARSEALAQLTERLPTIQLLRDGLFRACEAYANGALSPMSYSLVLSRYGDTMVTMLGAELIAGNFGRQLAAISGESSSKSSSSLEDSGEASESAKRALEESGGEVVQKTQEVADAAVAAGAEGADPAAQQTLQRKLDEQREATRKFTDKLAANAEAATKATATAGPALVAQKISPEQGQLIAQMGRDYIRTPSPGALLVACITALDRAAESQPAGKSDFAALCGGPGGFLAQTVGMIGEQATSLAHADTEAEALPLIQATVNRAVQAQQTVNTLIATPNAQPMAAQSSSVSDQVIAVQSALRAKGFYTGAVDGFAGAETTKAVRRFQASVGLPATGLLDQATVQKLLAAG